MAKKERRQQPRFRLRKPVKADSKDVVADSTGKVDGSALDISEGGVRFEARQSIQPGSTVQLTFTIGDQTVQATGQVVHFTTADGGNVSMGISFSNLPPGDQRFIEKYCRIRPKPDKDKI